MKRFVSFVVAVAVLVSLFSFASTGTASAHAQSTKQAPVCAVTYVYLHGHQPATTTCAKWATPGPDGKVTPLTGVTSCANPDRKVDIYDTSGHDVCFIGTGYFGFHIANVWSISSLDWGWVMMYPNGSTNGWYESLRGDGQWYYYNGNVSITQICVHC